MVWDKSCVHDGIPIPVLRPIAKEDGACVFYENGKCELHYSGKPLEGRLYNHSMNASQSAELRVRIAQLWEK
jgi:hypothetical protein